MKNTMMPDDAAALSPYEEAGAEGAAGAEAAAYPYQGAYQAAGQAPHSFQDAEQDTKYAEKPAAFSRAGATQEKGSRGRMKAEQTMNTEDSRQESPSSGQASGYEELDNLTMNFLEGGEDEFTYHQAELIRIACLGLTTPDAVQAAQFVLNRARRLAPERSPAKKIHDPFNDYIMDFVEQEAAHLTYVEAEIIRRAARGCDMESIDEIQYLLHRALKAIPARSAQACQE